MKQAIRIAGMHCVSCEMLLSKEFQKLPGVTSCHVSHRKGSAVIECDGDLPRDQIKKIIHQYGYKMLENGDIAETPAKKNLGEDYLEMLLIAICLLALIFFINELGLTQYLPDFSKKAGIGIAFLIGIVASLSTCLALIGGIVMSFGAMVKTDTDGQSPFTARAKPHFFFHIGRIFSFVFLGGVLGLIGNKINFSISFTGILTVLVSVVMAYIGLQILNIVPSITKLGFHLPKFLSSGIHSLQESDHHLAPLLIGALTFFLPCGFTQSMQLTAIASGSFTGGALIMGAFALGTMPVLLAVGVGSTYAGRGKVGFFHHLVGVIIIFFALYSFNAGLTLAGVPLTFGLGGSSGGSGTSVSEVKDDVQVVKMDVDWSYNPSEIRIKKGIPVRWEINGINVSGCASSIVVPKFKIFKNLNPGLNVIEFTPTESGTIPFSCGMGMLQGRFIVE